MTKRIWTLLLAGMLATGAAACNDNAEDHAEEARDDRQEAAEEMREGDTASARKELENAAGHENAAAHDSAQGDNTEGLN